MRKLVIFVSASIVSTCAISILSGERVTLGAVLLTSAGCNGLCLGYRKRPRGPSAAAQASRIRDMIPTPAAVR